MTAVKRLVLAVIRLGLVAAFAGLGVLGLGLVALAVVTPGNPVWRLVVVVLGAGGIAIASGAVPVLVRGPGPGSGSAG